MDRKRAVEILAGVLSNPTAPMLEHRVMEYVKTECRKLGMEITQDLYGNILARRPGNSNHQLAFVAHMDHPGFEALESEGSRMEAQWRGGVRADYFADAAVRFFDGDREIAARVVEYGVNDSSQRVNIAALEVDSPVAPGSMGMWDLPACEVSNGLVKSRALDDLAGCALILAMLEALNEESIDAEVWGIFTRAEEIGFVGAIALANCRKIRKSVPLISLEMSRAMPGAEMGLGPVVRLGDRSTVFDNTVVGFMREVAGKIKEERIHFKWQQKLMDGGSCEATAFNTFGYRSAGIALPLGNYHNMVWGSDSGGYNLSPEEISISDYCDGISLMVEMVKAFDGLKIIESRNRSAMLQRAKSHLTSLELSHLSEA